MTEPFLLAAMFESAIPEAVGGGAVAGVIALIQSFRDRARHSRRVSQARKAAFAELRVIKDALSQKEGGPADPQPMDVSLVAALVRIGMDLIGDPTTETGLSRLTGAIRDYNAIVHRLVAESSGASRAMGDHKRVTEELLAEAATAGQEILVAAEALERAFA